MPSVHYVQRSGLASELSIDLNVEVHHRPLLARHGRQARSDVVLGRYWVNEPSTDRREKPMADALTAVTWDDTSRTTNTTRLVTTGQAADYLGVSARTVKQPMGLGATSASPAGLADLLHPSRRARQPEV